VIALGRSAGFSLDEIELMFVPDGQPRIDRQMLMDKAEELDKKSANWPIARLPAVRRATWNVPPFAASCGSRRLGPPS
jgi:hypothetical protein